MCFTQVEIWVQIYNVPLACMNRRVAVLLPDTISEVVELSLKSKGCWGKFLRVKVRIDITKPLKRGIRVWLEEVGLMITSPIKYEKLPKFCFACGLMGHSLKECLEDEARVSVINGSMSKYGVWLRAALPERGKLRPKAEASSDHYGNIGEKQRGSKDTDRVNATTARSSDRNSV
ncbi:hypothetical protein ACOSQ3_019835 [Xanthoceras sorbifolium]